MERLSSQNFLVLYWPALQNRWIHFRYRSTNHDHHHHDRSKPPCQRIRSKTERIPGPSLDHLRSKERKFNFNQFPPYTRPFLFYFPFSFSGSGKGKKNSGVLRSLTDCERSDRKGKLPWECPCNGCIWSKTCGRLYYQQWALQPNTQSSHIPCTSALSLHTSLPSLLSFSDLKVLSSFFLEFSEPGNGSQHEDSISRISPRKGLNLRIPLKKKGNWRWRQSLSRTF